MSVRLFQRRFASVALAVIVGLASRAVALPIYGGPEYFTSTASGYGTPFLPLLPGNSVGNVGGVGAVFKYSAAGAANLGQRAVRLTPPGFVELGP